MLAGDNSILNQATNAREKTRGGEVQETVTLAAANNAGVEHIGGTKQTKTDVITQLHNDGKLTDDEVETLEENDTIVIGGITIDFSVLGGSNWEYDHATQTVKKENLTLKIGDYVNDKGTQSVSGFDGKWRVLGIEDGQLLLVTDTYYAPFEEKEGFTKVQVGPSDYGLKLEGVDGWNNGVNKLKSIGATYNNDKLEKGRSITVEDINKITGYNPNNTGVNDPKQTGTGTPYGNGNVWQYKNKVTYTLEGGKVWYQGTNVVTTKTESTYTTFKPLGETNDITSPYPVESTAYMYYPTTLTETPDDNKSVGLAKESAAYKMLFATPYAPYWLASPCVDAFSGGADWILFIVAPPGMVAGGGLWGSSYGPDGSHALGVRPAVCLKSNITPTLKLTDSSTGISTYEI